MISLDACIYTIISILGVAYPILLQVISRLDDKYSSARAVELFDQELAKKVFIGCLIMATAAVVIWFGKFSPPTALAGSSTWLRDFTDNSALLLVYGFTLGLLLSFFWLTHTILTYYNTQKFVAYLQRRHQQNRTGELSIGILTDVFLAVLSARNSSVLERMRTFFSAEFQREREAAGQQEVIYPPAYYELAYRITQELGRLGSRQDRILASDATGGGWLLGGSQSHRLSEVTYLAIWRNLVVALEYGQDDTLYIYWQNAYHHFEYALPEVEAEGEMLGEHWQNTNSVVVTARTQERERFLDFHHALGAVLLYVGKAALVRRMWRYTTSEPPHYWLLPAYSTEIFAAFARYQDIVGGRAPADILYPFPNETGVGSEGLITRWRCFYLVVLFLRQYTLIERYTYDKLLALPTPPADQPTKQQWLASLPFFRRLLTQALDDMQLLRDLGLEFLTKTWCHERQLPYPINFIDQVEQHLKEAFQRDAAALPLDRSKVEEFCRDSGRLLERVADEISHLGLAIEASDFEAPLYLHGKHQLVSKDNYATQPVSTRLEFSTDLATRLRLDLRDELARLFLQKTASRYQLAPTELVMALEKLALDESWIILNLGVNLNRIAFDHKLMEITANSYKGIETLTLMGGYTINSLLLIRRAELPRLRFIPLEPAEITMYGLRQISNKLDLYGSVLNVNEVSGAVRTELYDGKFGSVSEAGLATQALEMLALKLEVSWQKSARPIKLNISDPTTGFTPPSAQSGETSNKITGLGLGSHGSTTYSLYPPGG